jgi:hypothetical protein
MTCSPHFDTVSKRANRERVDLFAFNCQWLTLFSGSVRGIISLIASLLKSVRPASSVQAVLAVTFQTLQRLIRSFCSLEFFEKGANKSLSDKRNNYHQEMKRKSFLFNNFVYLL